MKKELKLPNKCSELYSAILALESVDECYDFFFDLCTTNELKAMEQRFEIAKMLLEGKIYTEILEQTGASSATVSRVNRSINYGKHSYEKLFQRMEEKK